MSQSPTPAEAWRAYQESDCIHNAEQVEAALDRMAVVLAERLGDLNPLVICVLHGGLVTAGRLIPRLNFPLQQDYLHATRYGDRTEGGVLQWLARPVSPLTGRHVLLLDDIHDEGTTLDAIVRDCRDAGATGVTTAALANKLHDRKQGRRVDVSGLDVPDRFVFGCGMDFKGYLRNLPGIHALTVR